MSNYCNITTDLIDVFDRIEEYNVKRRLQQKFEVHSGSVYKMSGTGYMEVLYENGVALTNVSSIASIDAASKWFYDTAADVLYLRNTDSDDPDNDTITSGLDWENHKTRMRDEASEDIDGMLDAKFKRPIPESRNYHTSDKYDSSLKEATALQTCYKIVKRVPGDRKLALSLSDQVTNDKDRGIIDRYNNGKLRFSWDITPDELGHSNIEANSANTGNGFIEIKGLYLGDADKSWQVEIDGTGATGTSTFKWSKDAGVTYQETTVTTNDEWRTLGDGLSIRFWDRGGSFTSGDKWDVYVITESNREDIVKPTIHLERS